jgi:integrase
MKPHEVDPAKIRAFVEQKLASGLKPATVNRCMGVLSTFFEDFKEQKHVAANPMTGLPRSTRRLTRSDYDTRATPFLQATNDIRRVFLALPEPFNVAFAVGALAGLRVGETLGLSWQDIDFQGGRLHIHQQMQDGRLCGLKDDEPRIVPLLTSLAPILAACAGSSRRAAKGYSRRRTPQRVDGPTSAAIRRTSGLTRWPSTGQGTDRLQTAPHHLVPSDQAHVRVAVRLAGRFHRAAIQGHGSRRHHHDRDVQPPSP